MCHFITLVAQTADLEGVRAVLERHGRAAVPVDNASVRKVLRVGEHQYLTTSGHCDCGTVLAPRHDAPDGFEEELAKEASRMRRKGWSETKIARAVHDRRKADARPRGGGADSIELWSAVLRDLHKDLKLSHAGLFVRFYSGNVAGESFAASRREVDRTIALCDALTDIEHDEVTVFSL